MRSPTSHVLVHHHNEIQTKCSIKEKSILLFIEERKKKRNLGCFSFCFVSFLCLIDFMVFAKYKSENKRYWNREWKIKVKMSEHKMFNIYTSAYCLKCESKKIKFCELNGLWLFLCDASICHSSSWRLILTLLTLFMRKRLRSKLWEMYTYRTTNKVFFSSFFHPRANFEEKWSCQSKKRYAK